MIEPLHMWTVLNYLSVYLGWGSTYLAIRIGVAHLSPAAFLGLRFLLAGLILLGVAVLMRLWGRGDGRWRPAPSAGGALNFRSFVFACVSGILILGVSTGSVAYAARTVPSGIIAIIIGCAPVLFAFFNRLIGGPKITAAQATGGFLGFVGIWILGFGSFSNLSVHSYPIGGFLLALFSIVNWSFISVVSKKLPLPANFLTLAIIQNIAAGIVLMAVGYVRGEYTLAHLIALPRVAVFCVWYLAIVGSCLAYTSYVWLLKNEPANRVSTYAFINPAIAVVLGALIGREHIDVWTASALALTSGGTIIMLFGRDWFTRGARVRLFGFDRHPRPSAPQSDAPAP